MAVPSTTAVDVPEARVEVDEGEEGTHQEIDVSQEEAENEYEKLLIVTMSLPAHLQVIADGLVEEYRSHVEGVLLQLHRLAQGNEASQASQGSQASQAISDDPIAVKDLIIDRRSVQTAHRRRYIIYRGSYDGRSNAIIFHEDAVGE